MMDLSTVNSMMTWSFILLPILTLLVVAVVVLMTLSHWEVTTHGNSNKYIKEAWLKIKRDVQEQKMRNAEGKALYCKSHIEHIND